jgi:hypothetical protein
MRILKDIYTPVKITIHLIALLALAWRLSDLVEEVSVGAIKMSMGPYHLSGNDALLAQILIIGFLAFFLLITRKSIV